MKRLFLLTILCFGAFCANAEIKFQSLNNIKGTNIVLVDNEAPENVEVTDAVFYSNGKEYKAKRIRCNVENGVATYKLKFKRLTVFSDCKVVLTINGKEVTVEIQKQL